MWVLGRMHGREAYPSSRRSLLFTGLLVVALLHVSFIQAIQRTTVVGHPSSKRTTGTRDETYHDKDVQVMSLEEFLGPKDVAPRLMIDTKKKGNEESLSLDSGAGDNTGAFSTSTRGRDSELKDVQTPDTTEKSRLIMEEMLKKGLLSQEEFDVGTRQLTEIQYAIDSSLESFDTMRPHKKVTCSTDGNEGVVVNVPLRLKSIEVPMTEERRASTKWHNTVKRAWCTSDDTGTPDKFSAIGLSHQETKCAVCENFVSRILITDVLSLAMCPEVESEVNLLAMISCDIWSDSDSASPLVSQMFGELSFEQKFIFRDLCMQFRHDLVTRMSPREIRTFFEDMQKQTRLEWDSLHVLRNSERCFHDLLFDLTSRICTEMACCPTPLTQGCPVRNVACAQCEYLLEKTLEVTSEPSNRALDFEGLDRELIKDYETWLRDDKNRVVAEIESLEKEKELIEDYLYVFKQMIKEPFATILGKLHPSMNCPRIRKAVNLAITEEARKEDRECLEPKEYMWKRNVVNRKIRSKRSCLDVYKETLRKASVPDTTDGVCDAIFETAPARILSHESPNVKTWLRASFPGFAFRPSTVERSMREMAKQCCAIVVDAWTAKSKGKKEANRLHEKWTRETRKAVVDIGFSYREIVAPEYHAKAQPEGRLPTNELMREMNLDNVEIDPHIINRLYEGASEELNPFFARLETLDQETQKRLKIQLYQTVHESDLTANKHQPYKTSRSRWREMKQKLDERYARLFDLKSSSTSANTEGIIEPKSRRTSTDSLATLDSQSSSSTSAPRSLRKRLFTSSTPKNIKVNKEFWGKLVKLWESDRQKKRLVEKVGKPIALCAELYPGMCAVKAISG